MPHDLQRRHVVAVAHVGAAASRCAPSSSARRTSSRGGTGRSARACVSASNLPPSTTWLPASSAVIDHMNGPLWYSGPGIRCVPSIVIISSGFASGSIEPGRARRGSASAGRCCRPTSSPSTDPTPRRAAARRRRLGSAPSRGQARRARDGRRDRRRRSPSASASSMIASSSRFGKPRRHRLRGRAELPARDRRRDELDAVRQRDRHEVALPDAEPGERARPCGSRAVRARRGSPCGARR